MVLWAYLQGSNRDADIKTDLQTQLGKERVEWTESSMETYTLPYVK